MKLNKLESLGESCTARWVGNSWLKWDLWDGILDMKARYDVTRNKRAVNVHKISL